MNQSWANENKDTDCNEAIAIMQSLWENYVARDEDMPCILKHGSHFVRQGKADIGLVYGDYYFVEILIRLSRPDLFSQIFPRPVAKTG